MSVGEKFAIICAECITDEDEREKVIKSLKESGRELILITEDQMKTLSWKCVRASQQRPKEVLSYVYNSIQFTSAMAKRYHIE